MCVCVCVCVYVCLKINLAQTFRLHIYIYIYVDERFVINLSLNKLVELIFLHTNCFKCSISTL